MTAFLASILRGNRTNGLPAIGRPTRVSLLHWHVRSELASSGGEAALTPTEDRATKPLWVRGRRAISVFDRRLALTLVVSLSSIERLLELRGLLIAKVAAEALGVAPVQSPASPSMASSR